MSKAIINSTGTYCFTQGYPVVFEHAQKSQLFSIYRQLR